MNHLSASDALRLDPGTNGLMIYLLFPDFPRYADRLKVGNLMERARTGPFGEGLFSAPASSDDLPAIITLLNGLPPGVATRCFTPGYTIEFLVGSTSSKKATLCWNCDGMEILESDGTMRYYNFDGNSDTAVALLGKLRDVIDKNIKAGTCD